VTLTRGRFTKVRHPRSPDRGRVWPSGPSYRSSVASGAAGIRARNGLAAVCVAVLAVLAFASSATGGERAWNAYLAPAAACPGSADPGASAAAQTRAVTCLVNWARVRDQRSRLAPSSALTRASALKGRGVASCGDFSHTPCGADFTASARRAGYRYSSLGENLYAGPWGQTSAREVVSAWLESPGHRANILGPSFRHVGAAPVRANGLLGSGVFVVWTATFGSPR
jgi:uncharacterized protein YkwD